MEACPGFTPAEPVTPRFTDRSRKWVPHPDEVRVGKQYLNPTTFKVVILSEAEGPAPKVRSLAKQDEKRSQKADDIIEPSHYLSKRHYT